MVSFSKRDGRNPQTGKTIQIAAKNVVKFKGCRIRRCSKLIVSFKPIIIKPSLWKVFYVLNDFIWYFYYLFLNLLKNYRVMISEKLIKGQLLIAEPSISGDLSFNRSVILLADHDEEGSVGFIINKPLKYTINDLLPEINASLKFIMVGL
jgi:hypothetical protein